MSVLAVLLLVFLSGAVMDRIVPVRADRFALQDPTAYPPEDTPPPPGSPVPTSGSGYPGITDEPGTGATPETTATPGTPGTPGTPEATIQTTQLPTITPTLTITATLPKNIFETENAEIGEGNVTPPPSETPGPTITNYVSPTPVLETAQPDATAVTIARRKNESRVDWGLFWIGFSIPVLSACGLVLYLLDQRPDFFRPRKM